jgi:hypothetical protein
MGSFPWGPHGPETSPNQVKPNPTAAEPVGQFGQDASYPIQPATAGTGGGASPFLSITASLLLIPLAWMFWVCLYPLTAAASVFTGFVTWSLLSRVLTASDEVSVAQLGGVIAGFAAAVIVSRVEYKLAQNAGLRWGRHVVRLILFGALSIPWIQAMMGDARVGGSTIRYILAVLGQPRILLAQLTDTKTLGIMVAVMVATHFLLWKAEGLRSFWHRRLFWLGLK